MVCEGPFVLVKHEVGGGEQIWVFVVLDEGDAVHIEEFIVSSLEFTEVIYSKIRRLIAQK